MKAALDVHYKGGTAVAVCVSFQDWQDSEPEEMYCMSLSGVKGYQAGRFYLRELPCLLAVLHETGREFESVLIDGFVHLQSELGKGLGVRLYESLPYTAAVIGIAKNPLKVADRYVPVYRGRSKKPLLISAIGWSLESAARAIKNMHGPYRIPTLIKLADIYSRKS